MGDIVSVSYSSGGALYADAQYTTPISSINIPIGTSKWVYYKADAGYIFCSMSKDGIDYGNNQVGYGSFLGRYYYRNDNALNPSLHINFCLEYLTITASASTGGIITPSGSISVHAGSDKVFPIQVNTGYGVQNVLVDGVSVTLQYNIQYPGGLYAFRTITANHTITASFFILPIYAITASASTGGTISPSGSVAATFGTSKTFAMAPNTGYTIQNVLVDGISVGTGSSYTFGNITANHTITASFTNTAQVITASAGTGGTISPSGSISVTLGQSKTFTFQSYAGYEIDVVTVDGVSIGSPVSYTFSNIQTAHSISVAFKLFDSYLITASASTGGTITPSGSIAAVKGANKTFTLTVNESYQLNDVLVDGVSVGKVLSYTFTNIQISHTIAAVFGLITYQIISTSGLHGTITPLGTTTVNYGVSQGYIITPDEDYIIQDIIIDGVNYDLPASGTLFIND